MILARDKNTNQIVNVDRQKEADFIERRNIIRQISSIQQQIQDLKNIITEIKKAA